MYFRVHTHYEYIHRTYGDATSITLNGVAIHIFFSPAAPLKMRQKTFLIGPYCPIAPLLRILSLFSVLTGKQKQHDPIRGHALNLCRRPSHLELEVAPYRTATFFS